MENTDNQKTVECDNQASSRKEDHIDLAFKSKTGVLEVDTRFNYEPLFSGHSYSGPSLETQVGNKKMSYPIWISSMTGGTEKAKLINKNLAIVCGEFGLGMGLGSCRQLLYENKRIHEFDIRQHMPNSPLFINLGIAQIEELIVENKTGDIESLAKKLDADGLIVHINPLQEWMQPEGDRIITAPIDTIKKLLQELDMPIIVKEVGQGFGIQSLETLLSLPLEAVDLAGFGGTNFSKLELLRSDKVRFDSYQDIFKLGHTCEEMINNINTMHQKNADKIACNKIIISGGVKNFLDGYYFLKKCSLPSIYAQASGFLKHALDLDELRKYTALQIEGLQMSFALLTLKS